MKMIKFILIFGALTFLGVSCSNSLSSSLKNRHSGCEGDLGQAVIGTTIIAQDTLFTIIPDSLLTKQQKKRLTGILKEDTIRYISIHFARLNSNTGTLLTQVDTLAFPISTDSLYVAVRKKLSKHRGSNDKSIVYTFWGGAILHSNGEIHLVYSKQGGLTGEIVPVNLCDKGFVLRGLGHGIEAIIRVKVNHKAVR